MVQHSILWYNIVIVYNSIPPYYSIECSGRLFYVSLIKFELAILDFFLQEIDALTTKNRELRERLEELETTKTELYDVIKFHFASCHTKSEQQPVLYLHTSHESQESLSVPLRLLPYHSLQSFLLVIYQIVHIFATSYTSYQCAALSKNLIVLQKYTILLLLLVYKISIIIFFYNY